VLRRLPLPLPLPQPTPTPTPTPTPNPAQVGVCFAAYRNLPHLVRARIVWAEQRLQLWLDLDNSGRYQS
jgi:hypothetical protein